MIVEMSRVLVVGPKRLLDRVVEDVQRLGAVHVDRVETDDEAIRPLRPDARNSDEQSRLEAARVRVEGLLGLLPQVPGLTSSLPAPAADVAAIDLDALDEEVRGVEAEARELSRRRLDAEEELELIRTYEGAVRALLPLLDALAGSRALETIGFVMRTRDPSVVAALRTQLAEVTGGRIEVVSRTVEEGKVGVVVAFLRRDAEAVRGFLTRAGISELRLPARYAAQGPAEAVRLIEERAAALPKELEAVNQALADLARRHRPRLAPLRARLVDRLAALRALGQFGESRYAFILHGWVPTRQVVDLRATLARRFGADVVLDARPADLHHAEEVPVLLDNPPLLRPFQRLVGLFRPPRYGAIDPTVYLALFFPLFVGIVIGDFAYGALFFALGWRLRNKARRGGWTIPLINIRLAQPVLADLSWIIRAMAAWIMVFGIVYLEFFGDLIERLFHLHAPFHRIELTEAFLGVVLALGITQVMLGYVLHLLQALRHRHMSHVFEALAMICGVLGLVAVLGAMGNRLPASVYGPGLALLGAFVLLVLAGIAFNRFAPLWFVEAVSGMGNVFSYARLFGVGLAAAVLANVANQLGGPIGPMVMGIVFGILFQFVFLILTIAGHIIQPARLNWVEFLTKIKYHDETGNPYRPLQKTGGD